MRLSIRKGKGVTRDSSGVASLKQVFDAYFVLGRLWMSRIKIKNIKVADLDRQGTRRKRVRQRENKNHDGLEKRVKAVGEYPKQISVGHMGGRE